MATEIATQVLSVEEQHPSPRPTAPAPNGGNGTSTTSSASSLEPLDIIEPSTPTQITESELSYPTGAKFWLPFLSATLVLILGGLDNNIVATAVPSITDHFHTVADVGWYSAAFRLTLCAFQFLFGKLYTLFSVKRVFLTITAIFLVGSVICATAVSSKMFVLGRAVTGLGEAGIIAGCFTLLVQLLPLRRRPVFSGVLAALEGVAEIAAPILGGLLTQTLGWRWCFWINLPLGGLTFIATAIFFPDQPLNENRRLSWKAKLKQLDLIGNLVFVPGLTCLFLALSWAGSKYAWSSPIIIVLFLLFAALLAGFGYDQYRRGDSATLPPRILKQRSVIAGFIFSMCTNSFVNVLAYYMPTYFQAVREYSPAKSGYLMLPLLLGEVTAMLIHGAGTSAFGYFTPLMLLASILMPVAGGLMTTWDLHTSLAKLLLFSGLAGFGGGIGFQGPQSAVQAALPSTDASLGLSVILFAQHFGPAVSIIVAQTIFTHQLSTNLGGLAEGGVGGNVENMGLSDLKAKFGAEKLKEVLESFDLSIIQTWYLVVGLGCATAVGSLMMEWRSVKKKQS